MNLAAILNILKIVLAGLSTVSAGLMANAVATGVPLPAWLAAVCSAIVGIAGALGVVSSGIGGPKVETKAEAVDALNKVQ